MTIIAMQFIVMLILGIFFPTFAWIGFKLTDFFQRKTKRRPVANQTSSPVIDDVGNPATELNKKDFQTDEDTQESDVHHLVATVPEGKVDKLENDDRFNKREIDRYEKQLQNLSTVITNDVEETPTDKEKLGQGFQEMASESERDRHITKSQLRQENNDLKKALVSLQEKNQRMAEAHQSDPPNNLAAANSGSKNWRRKRSYIVKLFWNGRSPSPSSGKKLRSWKTL
jgi:hypothetical protein